MPPAPRRGARRARGIGGDAIAGPSDRRGRRRILDGVLGEIQVPDRAGEQGDDARPLVPHDLLERGAHAVDTGSGDESVATGRTSIVPSAAHGHLAGEVDLFAAHAHGRVAVGWRG
jgi:hypothetical protein